MLYYALLRTLEFAWIVFYYVTRELFDDVATTATLLSFSLFYVSFLKVAVPGVYPDEFTVAVARAAVARVSPRSIIMLYATVHYSVQFIRIVWELVRDFNRSEDEEMVKTRRAHLLGLDGGGGHQ